MNTILPEMVGKEVYVAIYMMTNRKHGTLYLGVTSLIERDKPQWSDLYSALVGLGGVHGWPEQVRP